MVDNTDRSARLIAAGKLLMEAQSRVPRRQWRRWLDDNGIDAPRARQAMRIAQAAEARRRALENSGGTVVDDDRRRDPGAWYSVRDAAAVSGTSKSAVHRRRNVHRRDRSREDLRMARNALRRALSKLEAEGMSGVALREFEVLLQEVFDAAGRFAKSSTRDDARRSLGRPEGARR
ncbi:MAG: hypothetical protein ACE5Q3_01600 [Alphaproteobacteria bacterium]